MTMLRFLRMYFHNLFGMHLFHLERRPEGGYRARCSCGAYAKGQR